MSAILMPSRHDSVLVILDMQERRLARISRADDLLASVRTLITAATLLGVPVVGSEQDVRGSGATIEALRELLAASSPSKVFTRTSFAALADRDVAGHIAALRRGTLILAGIETHASVLQTALGALALGYRVHVAADATASRVAEHARLAERRLAHAGALIEPMEGIILQLCERADGEEHMKLQAVLR